MARTQRVRTEAERVASLEKVGPPIELRFGDDVVVLTKQPMQWDYPAGTTRSGEVRKVSFGQKFKSLYKVEHQGIHRGWIIAHCGWGAGWELQRLDRGGPCLYAGGRCLKARKGDAARDKLAAEVPALVREGLLGTLEEQRTQEEREAQARAERVRSDHARHTQWKRQALQKAEAKRDRLRERAAIVQGIVDRQVLSNSETDALATVISEVAAQVDELDREATRLAGEVTAREQKEAV